MQPNWRIFYDDGSTYDSNMGEPHEAPTEGFVCAVGYYNNARYIMHGWDFYCYDKDTEQWWGCNQYGLHDRLRRNLIYAYKEGRTLPSDQFKEAMNRAHKDPDFPQR